MLAAFLFRFGVPVYVFIIILLTYKCSFEIAKIPFNVCFYERKRGDSCFLAFAVFNKGRFSVTR